ncbi:MAG TPA: hypothetical protein VER76_20480, partial [Pyrinomonadaceae bacterium]|nr:hypothetical protein [Pyrinomonadaceae bacterium]
MKILETSREVWRRRLSARRGDAAAMLVVVVFCALFFGGAIFRGKFLIGGDAFFQAYPLRAAAWEMIRNGQLPLWTPLVFSGYPMLAMPQLGLAYPLTWGHLILPARHAEMIYILAPFLFAPAFTYAYLRETGRSRLAALFGGLSFGYGGLMTNTYGMNAVPTNALMWLPLLLVVVERARTRSLARSIACAALVYAMSVLTGHGQSFLFVGLLASAYALFLVFAARADGARASVSRSWRVLVEPRRWRPLAACALGMLLATGVGAFQILETMRAARRSIRSSLSYEFFVEASFTPQAAWRSFIAPLYHFIEVTTYISPLACALAACAVALALRGRRKTRDVLADERTTFDPRVLFWAAVAIASVPLMLGESTPLYRALYHVPVFNLFRRPSRHVFEWTFALSVLAAYGWDALSRAYAERARDGQENEGKQWRLFAGTAALVAAAALGALWWRASHELPYVGEAVPRAEAVYLVWKIFFTVALAVAAYFALSARARSRRRELLSACVVLLACFVEPHILVSHWWPGTAKTAARLTTPSRSTRYLQQFPAHENRVYVRANSATEEYASEPRFDAHDLTALYGLHNVAGYEGLLLERYSRALGGLDYDAVNPRRGTRPSLALFAPESHVLDLLNATRVVTFANLATTPAPVADGQVKSARDALDPARWQTEEEFDGIVILRNGRALPRAWLVAEAEAVDGETALRRIRGEDERHFDPRRTALLEVAPSELPTLAGGELSDESGARVVEYQANRLVIETRASQAAMLVVSEIVYPGWEARVDGERARIDATNYLLRGVLVPAGVHRVEMRYT